MIKSSALLLITTACPVGCAHCQYFCTASREPEKWMSADLLKNISLQLKQNDIEFIKLSGGDPLYDIEWFFSSLDILIQHFEQKKIRIATSGFWAFNIDVVRKILTRIKVKGIDTLEVSIDRFHLPRVPIRNIENILQVSNELQIKIVLRPLIDDQSDFLIRPIFNLIKKYNPDILFSITDPIGNAEILDKKLIGWNSTLEKFMSMYNKMSNIEDKIKMEVPTNPITLTFLPSGNVYSCCIISKGTFLGNVNKEQLSSFLKKFNNTLPGFIDTHKLQCSYTENFLPPGEDDKCTFCKENPFNTISGTEKEYIGKIYKEINIEKINYEEIIDKYNPRHEILLSIKLEEKHLWNKQLGKNIKSLFLKLKKSGIRFNLARSLPRCIFSNQDYTEIKKFITLPTTCFECRELFSFDGDQIKLCPEIYKFSGGEFGRFKNRKEILDSFIQKKYEYRVSEMCKTCVFFIRNKCDGLCFRQQ